MEGKSRVKRFHSLADSVRHRLYLQLQLCLAEVMFTYRTTIYFMANAM